MAAQFEKVAGKGDVKPGETKLVEVAGEEICLVNVNGDYFAVSNVCTHAGGPIDQGDLTDNDIECPLHGSSFDVRTGEATAPPAVEALTAYAVRVEGDDVLVGPK